MDHPTYPFVIDEPIVRAPSADLEPGPDAGLSLEALQYAIIPVEDEGRYLGGVSCRVLEALRTDIAVCPAGTYVEINQGSEHCMTPSRPRLYKLFYFVNDDGNIRLAVFGA